MPATETLAHEQNQRTAENLPPSPVASSYPEEETTGAGVDGESRDPGTYPTRTGNDLEVLLNGCRIFPAMLEAIENASKSICLETFVYWSGDIAEEFADALSERARAGLDVFVVLDWFGCMQMPAKLCSKMESAGVRVRQFRPLKWYQWRRSNNRTHRKLLIVDGRIGFIGGVGIADNWTGDAQDPDHWRDNHYRVTGPVVQDLQHTFFAHWDPDATPADTDTRFFPPLAETGSMDARVVAAEPCDGPDRVHDDFIATIASAQYRLDIVSPYFVPGKTLTRALLNARRRGVDITVLTAGKHIDRNVARLASRHLWGDLIKAGVRIHEYTPTFIHTKTVIVDDDQVTIGSANFDSRSCRINGEANIAVRGRTAVDRHRKILEDDLARSREVDFQTWKNRPLLDKIAEQFAHLFHSQI